MFHSAIYIPDTALAVPEGCVRCLASGGEILPLETAFEKVLAGDAGNAITLCRQLCATPCSPDIKLDEFLL